MIFDLPHSGADNRRAEIRLQHSDEGRVWIRIVSVAGCSVNLKPGLVQLLNISPVGSGFRCSLRFPVHPHLLMKIEWFAEGERLEFLGRLRWRAADGNGYLYGMQLLVSSEERLRLNGVLNRLLLKLCPGQAKIHNMYQSFLYHRLT